MRFSRAEVPAEVVPPVDADLPGTAFEFLQHIRAGAECQRERAARLARPASARVSSTKKRPEGVGVEGLPTTAAKALTSLPRQ